MKNNKYKFGLLFVFLFVAGCSDVNYFVEPDTDSIKSIIKNFQDYDGKEVTIRGTYSWTFNTVSDSEGHYIKLGSNCREKNRAYAWEGETYTLKGIAKKEEDTTGCEKAWGEERESKCSYHYQIQCTEPMS